MIPTSVAIECDRLTRDTETALDILTAPPEPIKKCMQCKRFYFKRGVAVIYVEPQRGAPTTGICTRCDVEYRAKRGLPLRSPLDGRKSL